ncbi:MAG: ferrochelatase [Acidobacteria bacterium]|nr:ferrochelatase [Acidobacteriota bacterium]MCL5288883.1 ferrochelatase [Acidobacteriota bacterium]
MSSQKKIGVVFFQLGGPDSLEAVGPFLYNLFCDPDIIQLPMGWLLRKPLARFIVWRRTEHVRHAYQEIGGRSPIGLLTERQARALERALAPHADARVITAMRYWHPFTQEAVEQLRQFPYDELVLLPLYPQYSFATTGSSLNEWKRCFQPDARPARLVEHFFDHPQYIAALADRISLSLTHFDAPEQATLLFSAHGLPLSFIERGDPYQKHVEETVRLVMAEGKWANRHILCYQSKVGRERWLEPSLLDTLKTCAASGQRNLLVCPVAFVTEHIETLHEINIEAREEAKKLGIEQFAMVPSLNDSPLFISALADLVLRAIGQRQ